MKNITSIIYKDYPNQPYISPTRDLSAWEANPEKFPYKIVEKSKMVKLKEGILPGDLIMLWRIGFDNFTNQSVIPSYFEYRYGVNSDESIKILLELKYAFLCNATDSLVELTSPQLKEILKPKKLKLTGKKNELITRIIENIKEDELKKMFTLRKFQITDLGREVLNSYPEIIKRHGTK